MRDLIVKRIIDVTAFSMIKSFLLARANQTGSVCVKRPKILFTEAHHVWIYSYTLVLIPLLVIFIVPRL
jgi:hypothetical protein